MKGRILIALGTVVVLCLAVIVIFRFAAGGREEEDLRIDAVQDSPAADHTRDAIAPITPEDTEVDGVDLSSTAAQVLEIYGEPLSRETQTEESFHNPDWTVYWTDFTYRGMEIGLFNSRDKTEPAPGDPGSVYRIEITGKGPRTHRGIDIGDSLAKVYA